MRADQPLAPADGDALRDRFAADIRLHLTRQPRQLPSRYFYDELGSSLFEAICRLPWYRVTRAEQDLLARHAREIFGAAGPVRRVVELGPGSGRKLATLMAGGLEHRPVDVRLIDVSPTALAAAASALEGLDGLHVGLHQQSYEDGLAEVAALGRGAGSTLVLFLGSNLGNFDRSEAAAFLRRIRSSLEPGDALLLGTDLVKPESDLLLAYDDPLGVTAAFNKNLLCRINRELGGDFDLGQFGHRAVWNAGESRVEMHLVSLVAQRVRVALAGVDVALAAGETIWTESSYKYDPGDVRGRLEAAGFADGRQWIHEADRFALTLVRAV